ncbi:putative 6-phosphogluconolactonase 4, chloroplastic [Senna tora]|uniref:Putative 6-phosphogluconolactonase 4, chloroplastic n=1 Tax=Senna tora TaxID=362788 RepID=A0A834TY81_9FABA|nr:putative 6-phosphogluconolactonase 4, chloroplastic [Senna tora]
MAFSSSVFSPQTRGTSLLSYSTTTSSFIPTATTTTRANATTQKSFYQQPLRQTRRNNNYGINEVKPKRSSSSSSFGKVIVKAISKRYENVEVLSKEHLAVTLAYDVSQLSDKFSQERGAFTVVFSAGSSINYLRKLVEAPYIGSIDWSKWHVFWVEEPVVPNDHLESNYKFAYNRFISKVPIPASNIHAMDDTLQADAAAEAYEATLKSLIENKVIASSTNGLPRFDLTVLDMGPDGHVGALFSDHPLLHETNKWVSFLRDSPISPPQRITLTLPVINASSNIAMVVSGAGKANAVYSALEEKEEDDDGGDGEKEEYSKLPAEMVVPYEGELKWYLENGAASKLFKKK